MSDYELLCDFKSELINTWGYDKAFAENLAVMADSATATYGDIYRPMIFGAVKSCKFVTLKEGDNIKEAVSIVDKENIVKGDKPKYETYGSTSVLLRETPNISLGEGGYKTSGVNKVAIVGPRFNWDNPESLGNMASVVDSIISNNLRDMSIQGDTLTIKNGLSVRKEKLSVGDAGSIERTFLSEKGIGLESGINSYMAQKIVRENYNSDYEVAGMDHERLAAGYLIDHMGLGDMIKQSRITKDSYVLMQTLGDEVVTILDEIHDLESKRIEALGNAEELNRILDELNRKFEELSKAIGTVELALNRGEAQKEQGIGSI